MGLVLLLRKKIAVNAKESVTFAENHFASSVRQLNTWWFNYTWIIPCKDGLDFFFFLHICFCPVGGALECRMVAIGVGSYRETVDVALVWGGSHSLVLLISGLTGLKSIQKMLAVSVTSHDITQCTEQSTGCGL